jgi:hypothetical protein
MNAVRIRVMMLAITSLTSGAVMSPAQSVLPGSGLIAHVEGKVYLNEQSVEPSNTPNYILNPNSVVRTEAGRAEIRFAGGVFLFLGENTAVKRIPSGSYNFSRFEVLNGSTIVITGEKGSHAICENEVTLSDFGLFRFDVFRLPEPIVPKVCGFKVNRGAAAVKLSSVIAVATPGKFLSLGGGAGDRVALQKFDIEQKDELDNWASQRISLLPIQ